MPEEGCQRGGGTRRGAGGGFDRKSEKRDMGTAMQTGAVCACEKARALWQEGTGSKRESERRKS